MYVHVYDYIHVHVGMYTIMYIVMYIHDHVYDHVYLCVINSVYMLEGNEYFWRDDWLDYPKINFITEEEMTI